MIFCRLYQPWNHSAFSPAWVSLVCSLCPSPSFWPASHLTYKEPSRVEMPASVVTSTSRTTSPTNAVRGTTSTYSYANTTPRSYWNYLLRWIFIWLKFFFFIILNNKACENVVLFLLVAMWTHHYKLWPVCNVSTLIVDSGCGDQPGFVRTEHLGILQSQTRLWRQLVLPIRLLCTWIQRDEGQIFPRRGSHWRRLLQ